MELPALDAARDHTLDHVDGLRELADPLGQLGATAELADHDADDVRQVEPRAQDDRGDVAQLVGGRLVGLLHARDARLQNAPVLVEDGLENLILRLEVVVEEPVRDACLLGDVADAARVVPLPREDAHGGLEELTAFVLHALRASLQSGQEPTPGSGRLTAQARDS